MHKATILFSDKTVLEVKEGDLITPVVCKSDTSSGFAAMGEPVEVWYHTSNGLIPSLLDVLTQHNFFYLNNDFSCVYNAISIIKIITE
ncbi:hypothetical protein [Senimuribacter intestinalis]|uniref:hypothetical protein n=1 Tax=Senimuribacter intestinalis TaxID=2941507 RepID=UPI00203AEEE2|nr:hypothetical protein [Senimuribacter intestinalis]